MAFSPLAALDADLQKVDSRIIFNDDCASATVIQYVYWSVSDGEMHGFYFTGVDGDFSFNPDECVFRTENEEIPLELKRINSSKYDVVLSGNRSFSGNGLFILNYNVDFLGSGFTGLSQNPVAETGTEMKKTRELFYFDWALPAWDQSMESRTTEVILPVEVPASYGNSGNSTDSFMKKTGFFTEERISLENKIDWYTVSGIDGINRLCIRFFQENIPPDKSHELKFYLYPDQLGIDVTEYNLTYNESIPAKAGESRTTFIAFVIVFVIIIAALVLYFFKLRKFSFYSERLENYYWAGDSWEPPVISCGTNFKKGKIAENLNPVEILLLLGVELRQVLAVLLEGLEDRAVIKVL